VSNMNKKTNYYCSKCGVELIKGVNRPAKNKLCTPHLWEYHRDYYNKNLAKKREQARKCISKPEHKARRKKYGAEWMRNNKDKLKEYSKTEINVYKNKARDIYRSALDTGKIKKQPCEICGEIKVDGHHTDYSNPLDVMWLCRKHHADQHRKEL